MSRKVMISIQQWRLNNDKESQSESISMAIAALRPGSVGAFNFICWVSCHCLNLESGVTADAKSSMWILVSLPQARQTRPIVSSQVIAARPWSSSLCLR